MPPPLGRPIPPGNPRPPSPPAPPGKPRPLPPSEPGICGRVDEGRCGGRWNHAGEQRGVAAFIEGFEAVGGESDEGGVFEFSMTVGQEEVFRSGFVPFAAIFHDGGDAEVGVVGDEGVLAHELEGFVVIVVGFAEDFIAGFAAFVHEVRAWR